MSSIATMRSSLLPLDLGILEALQLRRIMLTQHLATILLGTHNSRTERRIQRAGERLEKLKAIRRTFISTAHRMGGARALRWQLTKLGLKLALAGSRELADKLRYWTDGTGLATAQHTLGLNKLEATLIETASSNIGFRLTALEREPDCWRRASALTLKPDMYAETTYKDKSRTWFIELARGMVKPGPVLRKCHEYRDYIIAGRKTGATSPLPRVLWVLEDKGRVERLRAHVGAEMGPYAGLFRVLHVSDFLPEILGGPS